MFCPGNGALSLCPAAERVWEWGKGRRCHDASCRDAWCQAVWGLPWLLRSSPEAVEGTTSGPSSRDQRPPPAAARGPLANRPPAGRPQLHCSARAASGFSKALSRRQTDGSAKKKSQSVSTAFAWRCRPIHIVRSLYPALRGQVLPRCGGHVECGSSPALSGGAFFLPFHPLLRAFRTGNHSCVALSHP